MKRKKEAKGASSKISNPARLSKQEHEARLHATFSRLKQIQEQRKVEFGKTPHNIVYWSTLLLLLVCNFVISIVLIPFILALTGFKFYLLIILLGFIFGFLFNILIQDIEHIGTHHHVFAIIFMPLVAVINIMIMIGVANKIAEIIGLLIYQDPFLPALVYTLVFLLPYAGTMLLKEMQEKNHDRA